MEDSGAPDPRQASSRLHEADEGAGYSTRQPVFNAPAQALFVAALIPLSYLIQRRLPDQGWNWAFRPHSLVDGDWWPTILTSLYVHGSWTHALMNAGFALAFGPPVARLFGGRSGALVFFAYYIVCGVVAALGYGLVHLGSDGLVGGASGAVFGLMGGAIRLIGTGGRVRPLTDRRVVTTSLVLMIVNLATGVLNIAPGLEGAGIAWEAHAFGYLAGLILIAPLARLFALNQQEAG